MKPLTLLALASLGLIATTGVAHAEFSVCNQTFDVVNVAVGQQEENGFHTQGWWVIGANQCATLIRDDLLNQYIYVYANDVFGQPLLQGTEPLCIGRDSFSTLETESCWAQGYVQAKFFEVDTKAATRWTLFLSDPTPTRN